MTRFARLLLVLALLPAIPAQALDPDRILPALRIKPTGDVMLDSRLRIGRDQGGKFIATPERIEIQGDGSTGFVGGMSVAASGAATRVTINQYLARLPLPVSAFGAVGDGSANDNVAINAAIQVACARGGGTVILMKLHRLGGAIDNNCPGVIVEGIGSDDVPHDLGSPHGTIVFPAPGYAGDGLVHRTPTAVEKGVAASANPVITGGGFVGITASRFKRNLHVTSTRRGIYKVNLLDAYGTESALFDTLADYRNGSAAQMSEASDTQGMTLDITFKQSPDADTGVTSAAADGVVFTAYPGAGNPSYNFGMRLNGCIQNGVGWRSISSDNNVWDNFRVSVLGTGKPFVLQAGVANSFVNDTNIFNHYFSNKAGYIEGAGERTNGTEVLQTTINVLDASNSSVVPTTGAGATLVILNGNRGWTQWTPTFTPATGSFTSSGAADARFRRRVLDNTVSFTTTFTASYTSASGALRFTLPVAPSSTFVFAGREASTGWGMTCTAAAGSTLASCLRVESSSPLAGSGNFYIVSGTYETQ